VKEVIGNVFTYNPRLRPVESTPNTVDELLKFKPTYGNILRCVTTNGIVKKNGDLVMGAGVAREAKRRFNELPHIFGQNIDKNGNHVYIVEKYGIASFPTKHHWKNDSDINLIAQSCRELLFLSKSWDYILLTRPGCGLGKLSWVDVRPVLASYFDDDKFILVHPYKDD